MGLAGRERVVLLGALTLGLFLSGCGPRPPEHQKRWLLADDAPGGSIGYLLYLPAGYEEGERAWPLLLFLHGGECGEDLDLVRTVGLPRALERGKGLPMVVVCPQCREHGWHDSWTPAYSNPRLYEWLLDQRRSMGGAKDEADRSTAVDPD